MLYLLIVVISILLIYIFQVNLWRRYWNNEKEFIHDKGEDISLSLIIPFKDEAINLDRLLSSLIKQSYSRWELILVNDHSTDNGLQLLEPYILKFPIPLKILHSPDIGKKKALLYGVQNAAYNTIITSDADCVFHPDWLQTMATYQHQTQADLIIGPVSLQAKADIFSRFQQIDFAAIQLSGAAATLHNKAIMCNGANLLCNKVLYLQARLNNHIASGDDMFLLEWMKKNNRTVAYIKSKKATVETIAVNNIRDFLIQRARWASKAPAYRDKHILLSGLLVSSMAITILSIMIGGIWYTPLLYIFCLTLLIKSWSDYTLLRDGKTFFNYKLNFANVILIQLVYPVYMLCVLLLPLFVKIKWKERKI